MITVRRITSNCVTTYCRLAFFRSHHAAQVNKIHRQCGLLQLKLASSNFKGSGQEQLPNLYRHGLFTQHVLMSSSSAQSWPADNANEVKQLDEDLKEEIFKEIWSKTCVIDYIGMLNIKSLFPDVKRYRIRKKQTGLQRAVLKFTSVEKCEESMKIAEQDQRIKSVLPYRFHQELRDRAMICSPMPRDYEFPGCLEFYKCSTTNDLRSALVVYPTRTKMLLRYLALRKQPNAPPVHLVNVMKKDRVHNNQVTPLKNSDIYRTIRKMFRDVDTVDVYHNSHGKRCVLIKFGNTEQPKTKSKTPAQSRLEEIIHEAESQNAAQSQSGAENQTAAQSQSEAESQTAAQSQTTAQSQSEAESQTAVQSQSEAESQTAAQSQNAAQSQSEAESQTAAQSQSGAESQTAAQSQSEAESQTAAQSQSEAESQTAAQSQTTAQSQSEAESRTAAQSQQKEIDETDGLKRLKTFFGGQ